MQLSDYELLCAAQSDGENSQQARDELIPRFGAILCYLAGWACNRCGLHQDEAKVVVQETMVALLDPGITRFDPAKSDHCEPYLRGLVQNATREHARFIRRGDSRRHDYSHPLNSPRALPVSADTIPDKRASAEHVENRDLAAALLLLASGETRVLVDRIVLAGDPIQDVARQIGVNRTTVARRLATFYQLAAARHKHLAKQSHAA